MESIATAAAGAVQLQALHQAPQVARNNPVVVQLAPAKVAVAAAVTVVELTVALAPAVPGLVVTGGRAHLQQAGGAPVTMEVIAGLATAVVVMAGTREAVVEVAGAEVTGMAAVVAVGVEAAMRTRHGGMTRLMRRRGHNHTRRQVRQGILSTDTEPSQHYNRCSIGATSTLLA
jgi:hypothetical protein